MSGQEAIAYTPIGYMRSPYTESRQTPLQPIYAEAITGRVELKPEFAEGLRSIEGWSHIYLIYDLHRVATRRLLATPFLQDRPHGIFATRAPWRPNPIGLSIVRLLEVEGNLLRVAGVDLLDGTPILDIKPYSARFDCILDTRNGWQDEVDEETAQRRGRRLEQGEGGELQ